MHITAKRTKQALLGLFLGFGSINAAVSFFIGNERSCRWSLTFLALACAVWGIYEGIVHLYVKYAPSRLGDPTIHLTGHESSEQRMDS